VLKLVVVIKKITPLLFALIFLLFATNTAFAQCQVNTLPEARIETQVVECSNSNVSLKVDAVLSQAIGPGVHVDSVYYQVRHLNSSGGVITTQADNSRIPSILNCDNLICQACTNYPSACDPTSVGTVVTTNGSGGITYYPNGQVSFDVTVTLEVIDTNTQECLATQTYTTTDSCTINVPLPTPGSGCTPNNTCGSNGECLPTQICNSSGICEVSVSCPCDPNTAYPPGQCGGGGCPPTHFCWDSNSTPGYFYCQPDPINCVPCTDTSGQCGIPPCNLRQRCQGGWCRFDQLGCAAEPPPSRPLPAICPTSLGTGIDTAIGCIPITGDNVFTAYLLTWGIGIGGGIAFLLIIYSAFLLITSAGNPERLQAGRELLLAALAGLIMLIFSVYILRVIGVDILRIPGL
jgi:hypothetical protein